MHWAFIYEVNKGVGLAAPEQSLQRHGSGLDLLEIVRCGGACVGYSRPGLSRPDLSIWLFVPRYIFDLCWCRVDSFSCATRGHAANSGRSVSILPEIAVQGGFRTEE